MDALDASHEAMQPAVEPADSVLPADWRGPRARLGSRNEEPNGGRAVDDYFLGAASLAMLGVLVGLLILMLTQDVKRAMEQRRH